MNVALKTQCPHCRRPTTVRERVPAEMPTELGERVRWKGKLCVVVGIVQDSFHGSQSSVSYTFHDLEG